MTVKATRLATLAAVRASLVATKAQADIAAAAITAENNAELNPVTTGYNGVANALNVVIPIVQSAIVAANALPDPVVTPPVTQPPVPSSLIPVLGPDRQHIHQGWLADYASPEKLAPRALPWNVPFADPAARILALPKQGQAPSRVVAYHHCGNMTEPYSEVPYFYADGRSSPYSSQVSDDLRYIVNDLIARPPLAGARGIAMPVSYVSLIAHPATFPLGPNAGQPIPRAPLWVMVRHDATVQLWERDGAVTNHGRIPGLTHSWDACVDPNNRMTLYVATADWVNGAWANARIAKVDRTAGAQTATSPEDASKYAVTTYQTIPGVATSVRVDAAGNVWAIDGVSGVIYQNGAVWLSTLPAFACDYLGATLYVACNDGRAFAIDVATKTFGPQLAPANVIAGSAFGTDFYTISVDRNGTFGPVGNVAGSRVHTNGNMNVWQYDVTTKTAAADYGIYHSGQNWTTTGDARNVHQLFGHYGWIPGKYHDWEAVRAVGGYANCPIGLIVADPPLPAQDFVDYTLVWHGMRALGRGGPDDAQTRPALTCWITREGWSPFAGCSADEIADMASFDAMEAFLVGGMIGQFRRDDFTPLDRIGMLEAICRNSMRHLREGAAFTQALRAWYVAKYGAPPVPADVVNDDFYPPGQAPSTPGEIVQYLEARPTATGYRIGVFGLRGAGETRYAEGPSTNELLGVAIPADAVIVSDAGLPTETTLPAKLPPGLHALTVRSASLHTRATVVMVA